MRPPPRWLRRLGKLVLVALVTWALFRAVGVGLGELSSIDLRRHRPGWGRLALSFFLLVGVYLAHALLWLRIVGRLTGGAPDVVPALRVYFIAGLGRYLPGKFWQVAGLAVLAGRAGFSGLGATVGAFVGQAAFLATGTLFLLVLMPELVGGAAVLVAGGLLLALVFGWRGMRAAAAGSAPARWLDRKLGGRGRAAMELVERVTPRAALAWTAGYALSWVALGAAFWLFVTAFEPGGASAWRHLAGTVAAAYLGGYLALFAPAGVGVREGLMGLLLARVVPAPAAVVVAVASRVWFTAAEIVPLAPLSLIRARDGDAPRRSSRVDEPPDQRGTPRAGDHPDV